jgi:hypothetical protein
LVVITGEDTNWTINTHGLVESRANQFTIEEKTSHLSANYDYGGGDEDLETDVTT